MDDTTALLLLNELLDAVDPFLASQEKATDRRCGLVQPVTVLECEELNAVVEKARNYLEQQEKNQKGLSGA